MKTIKFKLRHAVRLTPITGETRVTVESNGLFDIENLIPKLHEPKYRLIASTLHGRYYKSRGGMNRILKITLPTEKASKEKFVEEMFRLFEMLEHWSNINHDVD